MYGDNIRLLIVEVIVSTAASNLTRYKNQSDFTPHNAAPLPPLLMEAKILDGETSAEYILKIFARSITERTEDKE